LEILISDPASMTDVEEKQLSGFEINENARIKEKIQTEE
jgi:hypothetical protein